MLALLDQAREPLVANEAEADIARSAAEKLRKIAEANQDVSLSVREMPNVVVPLPARAVHVILRLLIAMSERIPVSVIPHEAELTTQQAADYLNVSRPYLTNLIDKGEIKHRMVGRRRRVRFADLLEFEAKSKEERQDAIKQMVADAKRLNLE